MSPWQSLANAIIVQAADDYREESLWLNSHKPIIPEDEEDADYKKHLAEKKRIEDFFLSEWFSLLTNLDGEILLERLRKECME